MSQLIHNSPSNDEPKPRALLIALHFPPEGGSGTQRTLKFARYLPEFGWDVDVLTVRPEVYDLIDNTLLAEIPSTVRVHRTFCLDPVKHLSVYGRYPGLFDFLDRYVYWFPFGVWRGLRLRRQARYDVIYSTSPTRTAHLIGLTLAWLTGLPWVCDFRDPWIDADVKRVLKAMFGGAAYSTILGFLERRIIHRANHIIVNTSLGNRDLVRRFPDCSAKITVLPNGYDEADFSGVLPAPRRDASDCMVFLHTGEVYPQVRDPRPLLQALESLIADGLIDPDRLRVRFVGAGPGLENADFRDWLVGRAVAKAVSVEPRMKHRDCIAEGLSADVLLLLQCSPLAKLQIPAKAFEYLRTGRSVLTLAPEDSATADFMHAANAGWVVDPQNTAGLRRALTEIFVRFGNRRLEAGLLPAVKFERRRLTGTLAAMFKALRAPSASVHPLHLSQ